MTFAPGTGPTRPEPSENPWRNMALLTAGLVLAAVVALGAVVVIKDRLHHPKHDLTGTISVYGALRSELLDTTHTGSALQAVDGDGCIGFGGYSDMTSGADVAVKNGKGSLIATGRLGTGTLARSGGFKCTFSFELQVPDSSFYVIQVSHRGEQHYSKSDLTGRSWHVEMTLGL